MDFEELPAELLTPPEKRLVQTLITLNPKPKSFMMSFGVILFITLVTQAYWLNWGGWAESLPAIRHNVFQGDEYWRLFTSVLIHADIAHLASNMYMLGILSYFVYGHFGVRLYPILTFLGAGLVNALSIATYPPHVRLLGASGWVYLLGGLWLTLYLLIQRQYRFSSRLLRVIGIGLMIFFPTTFEATTSYRTHFIGFVVGMGLGLVYFLLNKRAIQKHEAYRMVG